MPAWWNKCLKMIPMQQRTCISFTFGDFPNNCAISSDVLACMICCTHCSDSLCGLCEKSGVFSDCVGWQNASRTHHILETCNQNGTSASASWSPRWTGTGDRIRHNALWIFSFRDSEYVVHWSAPSEAMIVQHAMTAQSSGELYKILLHQK